MAKLNRIRKASKNSFPVEAFPYKGEDYTKGVNDVLPRTGLTRPMLGDENPKALEWLKAQIYAYPQTINLETYDKEFKKILKLLNREAKEQTELGEYYPSVKKALMLMRRAIAFRRETRIAYNGNSREYWPGRRFES